jgi:hypothetical protein
MGLRPTQGDEKRLWSRNHFPYKVPFPLSSRAKPRDLQFPRTFRGNVFRQSVPGFHAELATSTYAPFRRERRMRIANANKFDRKSGGA